MKLNKFFIQPLPIMVKLASLYILLPVCLLVSNFTFAAIDLELTQGVDAALPIAIVPFSGQANAQASENISTVINNDLRNSGRFKLLPLPAMPNQPHEIADVNTTQWRKTGAESLVIGKVNALGGDRYQVSFALLDIFKNDNPVLLQQTYTVNQSQLRRLSHLISDQIYQQLTGVPGIFSTRMAYIVVQRSNQGTRYTLEIADADGYNTRPLLVAKEPIMSPAWSHDGKRIAFVSFENRKAEIYIIDIASGQRRLLSSYPGINGAPAWSPDDKQLALVLSKEGNPNIYQLDLFNNQLRALTHDNSINTEPNWAPDGQSIVFTSDRGGAPQIYRLNLSNGQVQRITYSGNYNAHAVFTPDGKSLVLLHRENGQYNIAVQDIDKGRLQVLTSSGRDESPSVSANGNMILYGSEIGSLGMVSIDGRVKLSLPARAGDVRQPIWSPFLQ